jgi:hypothetical protein
MGQVPDPAIYRLFTSLAQSALAGGWRLCLVLV